MKRLLVYLFIVPALLGLSLAAADGIDREDTRLLQAPAINGSQVAFFYDNDLWIAGIDGSAPHRLTTAAGEESNAVFSPDGSLIAFSGNYDGNTDIYVMPVVGGSPKRLTWHPGADMALDFTPDGSAVLFRSPRQVFTNRFTQLFTVPIDEGFPARLAIPSANKASFNDDGTRIAYTPLGERFNQWKNYRGGTVSRIWLYNKSDHAVEQIPQPAGRSNDTDPMWIGNIVYFRSDRNGEFNLFSYDVRSKAIKPLTRHNDFPVLNASADKNQIVYEQAGYLHILNLRRNRTSRLKIGVATDLRETRPRYVRRPTGGRRGRRGGRGGNPYIRSFDVSTTGARAVFEFRGEIITVPAEKGDPRNLTQSPGVHERSPVWSPDGSKIAYFSDASGEYELHLLNQRDSSTEIFQVVGNGFYSSPGWSPDSQKIVYVDNSKSLYWLDTGSRQVTKISQNNDPQSGIDYDWSHDSKWLAYTVTGKTYFRRVYVYSFDEQKSYPITDGLSDVVSPVFDPSGKYLYLLASTDAGPVRQWFDMSKADLDSSSSIYLAVLREDLSNPLARESDEETGESSPEEGRRGGGSEQQAEATPPLRIDFEGLNERIVDIPLPARNYSNLQVGKSGKLYFLERSRSGFGAASKLKLFDLKTRKTETLGNVTGYRLTADKAKLLYASRTGYGIAAAGSKLRPGEDGIDTDSIQVQIDPRVEWEQIFNEAWRINRDYFYATNFHGADWEAMHDKYSQFLPHLATRADLNRVIQWMCSELAVGHHRVGGGDRLERAENIPGGLLGSDYTIENGRYRFEKIYGGLNWNPNLRSPLTEPGVRVKEGEYLLAVRGVDLRPPTNLFSLFENTADKIVEIRVGPDPNGSGSRTVQVVPVGSESALRNRDWVEGNLKRVEEATNGRVAYVYLPNTSTAGHAYFKRYFFPQAYKDAIIVDERFNGGGLVADYPIDHLLEQEISYWHMRYGEDLKTPSASIQGPKVMLIDETAGSGGDLLPWMFRKFKIGKLIGRPTWGGLVGTLGFPPLMDGGSVSAPNLAIWTEDGWIVENVGVPPDIEVEQWPAELAAGRDPQLEKAIEVILEELEKNPPKRPQRPPYPIRNPRGGMTIPSGSRPNSQ